MSDLNTRLVFLCKVLGSYDNSSDGINYAFKCPSCSRFGSNKKKLVVHIERGMYHCWVCDTRGKSFKTLVKKYHPALLDECSRILGKDLKITPVNEKFPDNNISLPSSYIALANTQDSRDPDITAVCRYAVARGLSYNDLWFYKVGTCARGRYRRRLIVPSFDEDGNLNYFVARSIDSQNKRKYLNPRVSKSDIIFNELHIEWDHELTIVEGPFDLMKCNQNATCLLGSSIGVRHMLFKKIVKNQTPILLALDPDAIKKTHEYAKMFAEYGIHVRILNVSDYEDVGSMTKKAFMVRRNKAKAWKSMDRLYHMIDGIKSGSVF